MCFASSNNFIMCTLHSGWNVHMLNAVASIMNINYYYILRF